MSDAPFSELYLAHLRRPPRPGGWPVATPGVFSGEASDPDGQRRIQLQLRRRSSQPDRIVDARFRAFGCSATLVCASFVAERVAQASLADARALEAAEVALALALDQDRFTAAELAVEALRRALATLAPG